MQELTLTETIDWVAGSPPVSQPECGFHGEKCESKFSLQNSLVAVLNKITGTRIIYKKKLVLCCTFLEIL